MKNNKTVLFVAGGVALLLVAFFVGASSSDKQNTTPAPTPTSTWTPEPEPVYSDEELFLDAVNEYGNDIIFSTSDADLLELGWSVCGVLDQGYDINDIVDELLYNSSLSTEEEFAAVGTIVGGAVLYLCPEYAYMIDEYDPNSY
jgi:hypothetical protein